MTEKMIIVTDKKDITVKGMKEQLALVGVETDATKKDDIWEVYSNATAQLEAYNTLIDMKGLCLIKAFGDHGTSRLCEKCQKKQDNVYSACAEAAKEKATQAATQRAKSTRKMGHRTGDKLWGTRPKTMALKFCEAVLEAGEKGISMAEAKKGKWNPKGYAFKETATRLVEEKLVELKDGRYIVTQFGLENSEAPAEAANA